MLNINNKTQSELIKIKDDYVKKYIGDFNKPINYKEQLDMLNKAISLKN